MTEFGLSNEQERVARHGLRNFPASSFSWVELPTGPQELPPWVLGSKIWWGGGYMNPPTLELKTWGHADPRWNDYGKWNSSNALYREEAPGYYVAHHPDGRSHYLAHRGPLKYQELTFFKGYGVNSSGEPDYNKPIYHKEWHWATPKEEGFGGTAFNIHLVDQDEERIRKVMLRGPWHVSPPRGYVECGASHGICTISQDLFIRIFATYHPWHKLAWVNDHGIQTLDPVHSSWDVPKQFLPRGHEVFSYNASNPYSGSTT